MFSTRFLRSAAVALVLYGILGLCVSAALVLVGSSTFSQVATLSTTLEQQRTALVQSLRTASGTLRDTAAATSDLERSIDNASRSADQASQLANDSAGTSREMGSSFSLLTIFGLQPLAGIAPQFTRSADQLQQMAISLGSTRDALAQNKADVRRVGSDLGQLQKELDLVAAALSQPGVLGLDGRGLLPFQVAFYGMCLLVTVQSAFSLVAGVVVYRLQRALGTQPLFPVRTATTIGGHEGGRVQAY
jgi:hypothetical protein